MVPGDKLLDEAMDLARRLAALPAGALRDTKRAVNLHVEQAMATVMETALGAERDSMHSPEHVAIVARLTSPSGGRPLVLSRSLTGEPGSAAARARY